MIRRPANLNELVDILTGDSADTLIIAGGTDLMVQEHKISGCQLIDITGIADLAKIEYDDDRIRIGAIVTHSRICRNATVSSRLPILHTACLGIGSKAIRNHGTIGGNIAGRSPKADLTTALLALDASLSFLAVEPGIKRKTQSVEHYLMESPATTRKFITEITVTAFRDEPPQLFRKITSRLGFGAAKINMAFAIPSQSGSGARIALGGYGPHAVRLPNTEALASGFTHSLPSVHELVASIRKDLYFHKDRWAGSAFYSDWTYCQEDYKIQVSANCLHHFFIDTLAKTCNKSV